MTFGKEFTRAVEQKQIAQQDAERARFTVEKAEQERQANVIRAEGEAESADMIAKALDKCGDGLIKIRIIEAAKEVCAFKFLTHFRLHKLLPTSRESCTFQAEVKESKAMEKTHQIYY